MFEKYDIAAGNVNLMNKFNCFVIADESDESSIAASPPEVSASQSKGINPTSRRLTPRHKKRERKRESDLRKKRLMGVGGSDQERESTENIVVISNLGSLDI